MMISEKEESVKIIDFGTGTVKKAGEANTLKVGSVIFINNSGLLHRPLSHKEEL